MIVAFPAFAAVNGAPSETPCGSPTSCDSPQICCVIPNVNGSYCRATDACSTLGGAAMTAAQTITPAAQGTPMGGFTNNTTSLDDIPSTPKSDSGFVPLTSIPGIETVAGSDGIASFLNNLYKIAIGVAAVLAVLQITRAGLMYMTEESISEKKEARHLIVASILGLVLVLSPAIVFGIIDPRILELNVDVSGLKPAPREGATTTNGTGTPVVGNILSTGNGVTAGTRYSCLYPRQATDAVPGVQGNRPATVVEDESATEDRDPWLGPGNQLRVHFDVDPAGLERYVAAGDCGEIRQAATPPPAVADGYTAGQEISCYFDNYGFISGTVVSHTAQGIAFAWETSGGRSVSPNVPRNKCYASGEPVPAGVCGTPPSCSTGCILNTTSSTDGSEETSVCEPE